MVSRTIKHQIQDYYYNKDTERCVIILYTRYHVYFIVPLYIIYLADSKFNIIPTKSLGRGRLVADLFNTFTDITFQEYHNGQYQQNAPPLHSIGHTYFGTHPE